jgi:hypothetical protein
MLFILASAVAIATSTAQARVKLLRYRGERIAVPAGWPVYDLSSQPRTCVRFDRHAVYLGRPGAAQQCPAHAVGRTEAILIEPRGQNGASVVASWASSSGVIKRALGVRSLPAGESSAGVAPAVSAAPERSTPARPARANVAAAFTGLGFDACSAPSTAQMAAWGASPYRAVGIYIGGANRACAQPNLTPSWASQEIAAGWHLIPTYVGLQAPGAGCGCASIRSGQAPAEGTAAANDAVQQALALGLAAGNPIYYDMEGYAHTASNTSLVLAFLSAWTARLHALGYTSGVYSSMNSGIADLVRATGSSFREPDDIWFANWNGAQTTSDPSVPASEWASHQRVHQYDGGRNRIYGGVTLNVDGDYLDGATAGASFTPLFPDSTFIQVSGSSNVYRIAGGAPLLVTNWTAVGGQQPVTVVTQKQFNMLPPVPADGTFLGTPSGSFYRMAGGAPLLVTNWTLFGGPQPYVTIDPWDISHSSNPAAHLYSHPLDGTLVEGLPSQTYWSFSQGRRVPAALSASAIAVDDAGLARFPLASCIVPKLRGQTLHQAKHALSFAHCALGTVQRPARRRPGHAPHVITQKPRPGRAEALGSAVSLRLN